MADDHTVVRQGLRALLAAEEDIEIIGEAENGRQALQLVKKLLPDVVVMDIAMPVLNGVEATRQITRYVPSVKVLVLSTYSNDEYVEQLTEAGAAGYLVKQTAATICSRRFAKHLRAMRSSVQLSLNACETSAAKPM